MPEPAVQSSYMKNVFAGLEAQKKLAPFAAAHPELIRTVAEAPRVSWLPIAVNLELVEGLVALHGEERGLALIADCIYRQFDTPLWSGFVSGAVRLLGSDPGSLGRWIPEAVRLVFRGCGRWSAERTGEHELVVRAAELPPALASHALWLRCFAFGVTPLFTLCRRDGTARLTEADAAAGRASYLLRWKPDR